MPNRLGLYNVVWALGDGLGFAASGWLFSWRPDSIVWMAGVIHLLQWLGFKCAPRHSDAAGQTAMKLAHSGDAIPRAVKKRFMHTAWLANALGFLLLSGFVALTPFIGQRLGLTPRRAIWLASTLLFARAAAFVLFWKWEHWHYNRGWLKTAMWLAPAAVAVVFFVPHPVFVFGALIVFGLTLGLGYSASIYYSLDYGEQKGEHGGIHESILGLGILVGPLLAAVVSGLGGGVRGAELTLVLLAFGATGIGSYLIERAGAKAN